MKYKEASVLTMRKDGVLVGQLFLAATNGGRNKKRTLEVEFDIREIGRAHV